MHCISKSFGKQYDPPSYSTSHVLLRLRVYLRVRPPNRLEAEVQKYKSTKTQQHLFH